MRDVTGRGKDLTPSAVYAAVKRAGITWKRASHVALQRDESSRNEYNTLRNAAGTHRNWYFLDESGFGRHTIRRNYAWAPNGHRAFVRDNAPIHKACQDWMRSLTAIRSIDVVFLPPYSPDYNPIELFFKGVKDDLRGPNRDLYASFDQVYSKDEDVVRKELFKKWMHGQGLHPKTDRLIRCLRIRIQF